MFFKRFRFDPALVLPSVLSIVFPLIHLFSISGMPAAVTPVIDSGEYVHVAKEIVSSSFSFTNTDHLSSLYAWVIAAVFFVSGNSLVAVKVFQILLNCITVIVFFSVVRRTFSRNTAILAVYIWAFYGPVIFFSCEIISVSLILFFYVLSLYMLIHATENGSRGWWVMTGLVFGLAALARPEILGFSALLLCGFVLTAVSGRGVKWRGLVNGFLFLVMLASPLLFVGIENKKVYGEFTMLPTASGVNFYMGNNPDFKKSIGSRPGPYWDSLSDLPLKEDSIGNSFNYERNYFFYKKVAIHAVEHPGQYIAALFYKVRTLLNGYELPAVFSLYDSRETSPLLDLLVVNKSGFFFPFAFVFPLALIGVVVSRKSRADQKWLLIMWISFIFPLIGYWNSSRFRMVIVPFVIMYAAVGILNILQSLKNRDTGAFRTKIVSAILMGFLFNIPYFHFSSNYNFRAEAFAFAGIELVLKEGRVAEGTGLLDRSLELQKDDMKSCSPIGFLKSRSPLCDNILNEHHRTLKAMTYSFKGDAMMIQRKFDRAEEFYLKAIEIKPDFSVAVNNLGAARLDMNRIDEAYSSFKRALEIKPYNAYAHKNIAMILAYRNRADEAIKHFNEAIKIDPFDSEVYFRLGKIYEKMGKKRAAAEYYMTSLRIREIY